MLTMCLSTVILEMNILVSSGNSLTAFVMQHTPLTSRIVNCVTFLGHALGQGQDEIVPINHKGQCYCFLSRI